jgi:hypothetical protein
MVKNPAYARKAPWSERSGPAQLDNDRVEVRPRGRHARDHLGERRDPGDLRDPPPSPCPGSSGTRASESRRRRGPAPRASGCSTRPKPPFDDVRVRRAVN